MQKFGSFEKYQKVHTWKKKKKECAFCYHVLKYEKKLIIFSDNLQQLDDIRVIQSAERLQWNK